MTLKLNLATSGLLAMIAVLGMASASQAQCRGGGAGRSADQPSGSGVSPSAGIAAMGTTSAAQVAAAANVSNALQAQFQGAQARYLAGMHMQHNLMLQQIHQRQQLQLQATRLANQRKKRAAAERTSERTVNAGYSSKSKSGKSAA